MIRRTRDLPPGHLLLALIPPVIAFFIQWVIWSALEPYAWFLFVPAIFASAWLGGLGGGLAATALSTALVWWFFIPPAHSLLKEARLLLPCAVFIMIGVLVAAFQDRLRKVNAKLKQVNHERRLFAALVENSSDFIGIADPDGTPIYVNPAGRRMIALPADVALRDTQIADYYPPEHRAFAGDVIVKAMREQGLWQGQTYFRNWETDAAIPVSDAHFMIRDPKTEAVLGMGTVTRDISELERARAQIEESNRRLRDANGEIKRLYERTKELDELKTKFFASVSHELRTPLALILGPAQRMLGAPGAPDAKHDLEVIVRNARTLARHVEDLLDVSKLEAGRMSMDYVDADLTHLVPFVASHFDVLAQDRQITYTCDVPDPLRAQLDPAKLERVLLNLLSNAFKYTPEKGRVRVSVRARDQRVEIAVADSGPGIPADKREAVFERFGQLEDAVTRRHGGTGLGLAIARDFVTLHRGTISVAEAPEGGALFSVTLPQYAPAGTAVGQPPAPVVDEAAREIVEDLRVPVVTPLPGVQTTDALVLVVEDNAEMNRFLCESLMPAYRVVQAFDGKEGLRKAIELAPDLILADIMMPEMNGDEMIHAIRSHRALDRTPIVILTAKAADDALRIRLLREGGQDYLTKPFNVDELRARVANLVAARKAGLLEAQVVSLVEQAPEGIFVADLEGRYTDVNTAGCRLLGYSRDEIIGKTIVDFIAREDLGQLEQEKAQLVAGAVTSTEWRLRRKDGSYVSVEVTAKILPDGRWQAFVRDISERKRLETALHARSQDLERAQSVAQVGSWRLDSQHDELFWSDEACRIFETPSGPPMSYESFLACVHPDDREYVDRMWTAALHGARYDIEHRLLAGGHVKWVREKAELEFDERGALLGGLGITQDITERKRLEAEIRYAQDRFELALRGADLATWDWNIKTGEATFNSRWAEMRGLHPDEIEPRVESWVSGVHPDDLPRVQEVLDDYLAGRVSEYESEHRVRTKTGDWIWILDRGKIFARDEAGRPIRMVGTELDITARKRAEAELRLAHAVAAGISEVSADAIVSVDGDQHITMFNAGAEKIFGHSRHDVIGAPLDILIPPRLRARHRELVDRFAAGPDTARKMGERHMPVFGLRKDGNEFPADAAISRLEVGGQAVLTATIRDITEQKRVEHEQTFLADLGLVLATSLDYEETLTKIAALAVRDVADLCIVDVIAAEGDIQRVHAVCVDPNRAWIADRFMTLELDRRRPHLMAETLTTGRSVLIERVSDDQVAALAQSEEHLQLLRAAEIRSLIVAPLVAHGQLVGGLGLISSTPERLYGPLDLQLAEDLGRRAAFAIENARLYSLAQRAIRARDDVLGVVAHDLRNPLNTIGLQAEMLDERAAGDVIQRAARRMNRLIQDLLDVTQMDSGRLAVDHARVSTREVLSSVLDAQRPLAEAAGLDLDAELAPDLPDVWADRDRLLQIFENLIGNALKFTEHGGIAVGAVPREREVLFWVRDTGAGIGAEELPHLFDRFWQGHTREKRMGAGLGLAIVKGLVEAHGGHIWVESAVGRGTNFYFTIPTAPQTEQRPPVPAPHAL